MRNLTLVEKLTLRKQELDIEKTLDCGQCFRWTVLGGVHMGIIERSVLIIRDSEAGYDVEVYGESLGEKALFNYFDLDRDYSGILEVLSNKDDHMARAVNVGKGIRLLKQPLFEILISFILSSNNNIPKIKMTLEALCERFGEPLGMLDGNIFYAFPTPDILANASLEALNVKAIGYRAKYLSETAKAIVDQELDLNTPFHMDYNTARSWLKQFHGIGDKVADCILLFGYSKMEAFPVDTWVKQMLSEYYGVESKHEVFIREYFKHYPGIAQQYLFYMIRKERR